jgi:hypothetical protein
MIKLMGSSFSKGHKGSGENFLPALKPFRFGGRFNTQGKREKFSRVRFGIEENIVSLPP